MAYPASWSSLGLIRQAIAAYWQQPGYYLRLAAIAWAYLWLITVIVGVAIAANPAPDPWPPGRLLLMVGASVYSWGGYWAGAAAIALAYHARWVRGDVAYLEALAATDPDAALAATLSPAQRLRGRSSDPRDRLNFMALGLMFAGGILAIATLGYRWIVVLGQGLYLLWGALTGLTTVMFGLEQLSNSHHWILTAIALLGLVLLVSSFWVTLRVAVRFFLVDILLRIAPARSLRWSVRHSWRLTRPVQGRLCQLVLLVSCVPGVMVLPLQAIVYAVLPLSLRESLAIVQPYLPRAIAVVISGHLLGWLMLPLWQILKTQIYLNLLTVGSPSSR